MEVAEVGQYDHAQLHELWVGFAEEIIAHREQGKLRDDYRHRIYEAADDWIAHDRKVVFGLFDDDSLRGFIAAQPKRANPLFEADRTIYIQALYVEEALRDQGYGRQLAETVEEWSTSVDADLIRLSVEIGNRAGRAFWSAQDYELSTQGRIKWLR